MRYTVHTHKYEKEMKQKSQTFFTHKRDVMHFSLKKVRVNNVCRVSQLQPEKLRWPEKHCLGGGCLKILRRTNLHIKELILTSERF